MREHIVEPAKAVIDSVFALVGMRRICKDPVVTIISSGNR